MEHENRVPQTGMSPQGWKENHTSPHKPVHAGTQTHHTHTHILTHITHTHTHTHRDILILEKT